MYGFWSLAHFAPKLGHFCPEVRLILTLKLASKCWKNNTDHSVPRMMKKIWKFNFITFFLNFAEFLVESNAIKTHFCWKRIQFSSRITRLLISYFARYMTILRPIFFRTSSYLVQPLECRGSRYFYLTVRFHLRTVKRVYIENSSILYPWWQILQSHIKLY